MKFFKKKSAKWFFAILILLSIIAIILLVLWNYYDSKLNMIQYDDGSQSIDTSVSIPVDNEEIDIPELPEPPPERVDGKVEILPGDIYHDEDVFNILLLGTDERSKEFSDNARADAIMILSLDLEHHTIKLVSIERGIGVPIPGRNDDWITHTFRYGGAELTMQTVRDCFKVDVDRYVRVNLQVFEDGIDAIGGITINLTEEEAGYLNKQYAEANYLREHRDIEMGNLNPVEVGMSHLNGATALNYARIRTIDSDWKRIERQRAVIQSALNQTKGLELEKINKLIDTILPMIKTNLTKEEITKLLFEIPQFIVSGIDMEQMTVPTWETCWNSIGVDGRKLIGVDFEANAAILKDFFYEIN